MDNEISGRLPLTARILIGITSLWFAFAVVYLTDAACDFTIFFALLCSGIAIGFVWVIITLLSHRLRTKPSCLWFSVPLGGAVASVLAVRGAGLALRVYLCDGALGEYVVSVPPEGIRKEQAQWIGLFRVEEATVCDGGVYLYTSQSWLNRHGVAHIPIGSKVAPRTSVQHLYGQWFRFEWRF